MHETSPSPVGPGLKVTDIYHILFRHKWKILLIWTLGLVAAGVVWQMWKVTYRSEAKIFVRYILERRTAGPGGGDPAINPNRDLASIVQPEMEILTSYDLMLQVAEAFGPEKLLAHVNGGNDKYRAAGLIQGGLHVEAAKGSAVIHVSLEHPNREVVQPVLSQIIDNYLKKHAEVHQAVGTRDQFLRETDQLKAQLAETAKKLREAKTGAGVTSIEDTKKSYLQRLTRVQESMFDLQAELAEHRAVIAQFTNAASVVSEGQTNVVLPAAPPADKVHQYKQISLRLEDVLQQERELARTYTSANSRLRFVQEQIEVNRRLKEQLEAEYPQLIATQPAISGMVATPAPAINLAEHTTKVIALESRTNQLHQQLETLRSELAAVVNMEDTITELERQRDLQEEQLRYFQNQLERTRIDDALSSGRTTNISPLQAPSPATRDYKKLSKILMLILGGAFAGGLALAFVIEMFLDRSVKRPIEVEARIGMPLFLSIPRHRLPPARVLGNGAEPKLLTAGASGNGNGSSGNGEPSSHVPVWSPEHQLRLYFDTLRDRLITHFEVNGLTRKPKLVAVTGCAGGSGVSTVASGLAASLSETGEGRVLLVNMDNAGGRSVHHFYRGGLDLSLDDALIADRRNEALVQENLYVVSGNGKDDHLDRILHKRFTTLVPRLKASDYDYIIFDMPPVSPTSSTLRVARFMDMMMLVVESEKDDAETAKLAAARLSEHQTPVSIVLNKTRNYVPRMLQQETLT